MSIQAILPISVDFCNKKYTLVNAKQYDKEARYLLVSCYNGGDFFKLSNGGHSAFVRYKKPDGYSVFRKCSIDTQGKILVELTEQMLAVQGTCVADLVIVSGGKAVIDVNTGKITNVTDGSIISTMIFHINVSETPVDNAEIESSYDHSGFNQALAEVTADFQNVILTAKSWAVGGTGIRANEATDNAKYWAELAKDHVMGDLGDSIVTGIRGINDTVGTFSKGNVELSAYRVGAVSLSDVATVDEVKSYLSINTTNS